MSWRFWITPVDLFHRNHGAIAVWRTGASPTRRKSLKQWLATYISAYHRQNPAQGCVIPTLSADVARSKPEIREAYRYEMVDFIQKISKVLDGAEPDREKRAWRIVAIMVGVIAISRAMPDGEEADKAIDRRCRLRLR
jgi:TetR/AcrR family transcriptional regulator, transcriptional repressor for nem operon